MKNFVLCVLLFFFLFSCSKEKSEKEIVESYHIYTIEPYLTSCFKCKIENCGGLCPPLDERGCRKMECFVIVDDENRILNLHLDFFKEYEKGYRYRVKVLKKVEKLNRNPYPDEIGTPYKYEVVEVLTKIKVE